MHKSTFEEEINKTGKLIYTNVGDSMMPLIRQGKDLLIIEKVNGRLKKYDVPLYKRDSGQYVLHRILKVRKNDYVICGDNRWGREYGIQDRHIIGVLTGIIRDGKEISVNDKKYKIYVHLWCDFFWIRAFILRTKHFIKRRLK
ncbi:MAG: S24/S26 family peptidase [Oscillospiraceae bacterium]|nr:S24/S26 family peptidase [Oscillospiraceae bacterium]MDD6086247.1 S24/S26 family peptidase [Oscillospiraceae bacterium]MDY3258284.1 S24/S26 family peptidase [Ruminococcus callidus]